MWRARAEIQGKGEGARAKKKKKKKKTYLLGNQAGDYDKGRFGFGEDGRGAEDVAVREAHREPEVFGAAVVEGRHDALGHLAVALVEEGLAAGQHLRRGRFVHVVAPVGRRGAVRLIRQVAWDGLVEFLKGVDGLTCETER